MTLIGRDLPWNRRHHHAHLGTLLRHHRAHLGTHRRHLHGHLQSKVFKYDDKEEEAYGARKKESG